MTDSTDSSAAPVAVGIGEVLFDCFADRQVLGGAPVNLTVHIHQLLATSSGRGVVVSRVGNDDLGQQLLNELDERGLATEFVQVDSRWPTGTVHVELNADGEPTYEIVEKVAWDHLENVEALERLARNCNAVSFGTLAQRSEQSRATIQRFLGHASNAIRFFDVNLRQSYFTSELLFSCLEVADVVKLNQSELAQIAQLLPDSLGCNGEYDQTIYRMIETFQLRCVAVTRGQQGTLLYQGGRIHESDSVALDRGENADNVGAGDACAAGLLFGLLNQWTPAKTLLLANRMGAFVASQSGATPRLPPELLSQVASLTT